MTPSALMCLLSMAILHFELAVQCADVTRSTYLRLPHHGQVTPSSAVVLSCLNVQTLRQMGLTCSGRPTRSLDGS